MLYNADSRFQLLVSGTDCQSHVTSSPSLHVFKGHLKTASPLLQEFPHRRITINRTNVTVASALRVVNFPYVLCLVANLILCHVNHIHLWSFTRLVVIWSYPEQGYNSATGHFVWLVWSPGTVYHLTFVRHLHYQRSKACSRHICSLVPTSLTNCFQSMSSEHCTAPCYCAL